MQMIDLIEPARNATTLRLPFAGYCSHFDSSECGGRRTGAEAVTGGWRGHRSGPQMGSGRAGQLAASGSLFQATCPAGRRSAAQTES